MYIVKEKDESKIDKVAELVGQRSKKLQDTVKAVHALKGDAELSVETIDQAIGIVNEEKKWTDLVGCWSMVFPIRSKRKRTGLNFISWPYPEFEKEPFSKRMVISALTCIEDPFCGNRRKGYIKPTRTYGFKSDIIWSSLTREKPLERGIMVVRNR
jgi:hypothetical protein